MSPTALRLAGKVAIITGGGSGIGRAASLLFAQEGCRVVVVDWSEEGGRETERLLEADGGERGHLHPRRRERRRRRGGRGREDRGPLRMPRRPLQQRGRVHAAGGLCSYDQANLNGIMGVARAKEAGFDLCHFNLHKTFSSPHGSMGPGCGAVMVREDLRRFLPRPLVESDGERYSLDYDLSESIGTVRAFLGNLQVVLRSYAWVMSLGAEGLRRVSETAVINNRYLMKRFREVPGLDLPYSPDAGRLDEARFSWGRLKEETGVGTEDVERRILDYGVNNYFSSHEPWVVPEPFTPEPAESYSLADLDEYAEIIKRVAEEAYVDPEVVTTAPHKSSAPRMDESPLHEIEKVVTTWRVWKRLNPDG